MSKTDQQKTQRGSGRLEQKSIEIQINDQSYEGEDSNLKRKRSVDKKRRGSNESQIIFRGEQSHESIDENESHHTQNSSPKSADQKFNKLKTSQSKQKDEPKVELKLMEQDFLHPDHNGRNIMHRAAIEQNDELLTQIIKNYQDTVIEQDKVTKDKRNYLTPSQQVLNYLIRCDDFGNTPLYICCIQDLAQSATKVTGEEDSESDLEDIQENKTGNQTVQESEGKKQNKQKHHHSQIVIEGTRFKCVKLILDKIRDILLQDIELQTQYDNVEMAIFNYVNKRNPRTLWTAIHWCSNYGDRESIEYLYDNGALIHLPDYNGTFAIDLAGTNGNDKAVHYLFRKTLEQLNQLEEEKQNKNKSQSKSKLLKSPENEEESKKPNRIGKIFNTIKETFANKQNQIGIQQVDRKEDILQSSLFQLSTLYWATVHKESYENLKKYLSLDGVYVEAPMFSYTFNTPLHAAAKNGDAKVLELFAAKMQKFDDKLLELVDVQRYHDRQKLFIFKPHENRVLNISKLELKTYRKHFIRMIKFMCLWEFNFLQNYSISRDSEMYVNYINVKELIGNTPLHLASIHGKADAVKVLLKNGADMELENREGWRSRELGQIQEIANIYQDILDIDQSLQKKATDIENKTSGSEEILDTGSLMIVRRNLEETLESLDLGKLRSDADFQQLFNYTDELFVPDIVLKFELKLANNNAQDNTAEFDGRTVIQTDLNRINFQINLLVTSHFQVDLFQSIEPGFYYVLLQFPDEKLEVECKNHKFQVKLIDSYDFEPYDNDEKEKYQPFRSRQRQQIIEASLVKIMNLSELRAQGILNSFYRMHTYGGVARIQDQWMTKPQFYWPQPLNQMDDYLQEGKTQNFTSLTLLKQYLGEKIAFFFAWKSFTTCILFAVAIPGLALQLYILYSGRWNHWLIPFWVFYICVWSTFIVEFWQRKTSELNYRWGTLDIMDKQDADKQFRETFSGDEIISNVTGELTKYQEQFRTILVFLSSIPILLFLMFLVVGTFLLVKYFQTTYGKKNPIIATAAGLFQGVAINILNLTYTKIAYGFAEQQNHKFEFQYERSLIYKNMIFKFVNSYFALYYTAFVDDSDLEDLFYILLPLIITKQVVFLFSGVIIPYILYQRRQKQYFNKVEKLAFDQEKQQKNIQNLLNSSQKEGGIKRGWTSQNDIIDQIWEYQKGIRITAASRPVINLNYGQNKSTQAEKQIQRMQNIFDSIQRGADVDSIELNSLKIDFTGTINYYADSFIDIGYISLFAAAFPIGPFLLMLANILEIQNKLYVFIFIMKRPKCERCTSIGEWLNIWETMSFVSVISNFALLYVKRSEMFEYFFGQNNVFDNDQSQYLWFFIFVIGFLIFVKYLFQVFIQDKPAWVEWEQRRRDYEQAILREKENDEAEKKVKTYEQKKKHLSDQLDKIQSDKDAQKKKLEKEIKKLIEQQDHYQNLVPPHLLDPTIADPSVQKPEQIEQEQAAKKEEQQKELQFYKIQRISLYRNTFFNIEREILIERIHEISKLNDTCLVSCNECNSRTALIDCLDCEENFCLECFQQLHSLIKAENHQLKLIREERTIDQNILFKYNFVQEDKKQINNFVIEDIGSSSSKPNNHPQNQKAVVRDPLKRWRQFEYFSLPTYIQSDSYHLLQQIFDLYHEEYVANNGINEDNEVLDNEKVFQIQKYKDPKGVDQFEKLRSNTIQKIISMQDFNLEDQLWTNRLMYLLLRRKESNTVSNYDYQTKDTQINFDDFHQMCRGLQQGLVEQKIMLLADLLDENDDQVIQKDQCQKIFVSSFLQDSQAITDVEAIINEFFAKREEITQFELIQKLLDLEQNPNVQSFVYCLLQSKDTPTPGMKSPK